MKWLSIVKILVLILWKISIWLICFHSYLIICITLLLISVQVGRSVTVTPINFHRSRAILVIEEVAKDIQGVVPIRFCWDMVMGKYNKIKIDKLSIYMLEQYTLGTLKTLLFRPWIATSFTSTEASISLTTNALLARMPLVFFISKSFFFKHIQTSKAKIQTPES